MNKIKQLSLVLAALTVAACSGSGGGNGNNNRGPVAPEPPPAPAEPAARTWNEEVLHGIRNDYARPTVHARNLFHSSAAMYDAWAAYSDTASTYLLGKTVSGFSCGLNSFLRPNDIEGARAQAMSHAVYQLMLHRFRNSPGAVTIRTEIELKMQELGYDFTNESLDYAGGSAAALGNYIADCYIRYGQQDASNETFDYANTSYVPSNPPIVMELPGNPDIIDLDRWQPIRVDVFVDQAGNTVDVVEPEFLSPEWGQVPAFALQEADRTIYQRDGFDYWVYHDPGPPPSIYDGAGDLYKWGFSMVSIWSAHLDPADGVMIDISPASIGNNPTPPADFADYDQFYDYLEGGDSSQGRDMNPVTGQPYAPQIVPRADYARVLAEFWADGPDSETPPGHWFTILNDVAEHPELEKRFAGAGEILDDNEWYVKAYFTMGGAMHDSAISAWGIKGWYDYIRPLSAIRGMAERGQSSDPAGPSYHPEGLPLVPGLIEVVEAGDPLADNPLHIGKIKLYAWRGPIYIDDPEVDVAGVGWILADNWWPYQRPTFITPPFAGYVSGHSTYSAAAAEVMTAITGSEYFPGGMSGFEIRANEFLVFEEGPSVDMTLQWATYKDASDQTSLSRIWGGIHPPADDIPGRFIGEQIGPDAFALAVEYFNGER